MADVVPVGSAPNDGTGIDWRSAFIAVNAAFAALSDQLSRVAAGNSVFATKADITAAINGLQAAFDAKADVADVDQDVATINSQLSSFSAQLAALSAQVAALIANPPGGGSTPETRTVVSGVSSYPVKTTDTFVAVGNLNAPFSANLPSAASYPINKRLVIFDEGGLASAANQVSAIAASGDTIEGAPSISTGTPYGKLVLVSNGVHLWLVES